MLGSITFQSIVWEKWGSRLKNIKGDGRDITTQRNDNAIKGLATEQVESRVQNREHGICMENAFVGESFRHSFKKELKKATYNAVVHFRAHPLQWHKGVPTGRYAHDVQYNGTQKTTRQEIRCNNE